ncbi:MAG: class I SAM-dependent methyltransferase [Candidatus Promineifilaceae bacterium]
MRPAEAVGPVSPTLAAIRDYWNEHVHDLSIARHPAGTPEFFRELDAYRLGKLGYLPQRVNFAGCRGQQLLEVGCGLGLDLARFARGGAAVTGVDLAPCSIELAQRHFAQQGLTGRLLVMDGEALEFADDAFDVVYAHGVLQYTADAQRMLDELWRVLKPGGQAILMVYNRYSWLSALSWLTRVGLEHADAPVLRTFSAAEFRRLLAAFSQVRIVPERFPVETRLHHGLKARLYNDLFVGSFRLLPQRLVRPLGWHLLAFGIK